VKEIEIGRDQALTCGVASREGVRRPEGKQMVPCGTEPLAYGPSISLTLAPAMRFRSPFSITPRRSKSRRHRITAMKSIPSTRSLPLVGSEATPSRFRVHSIRRVEPRFVRGQRIARPRSQRTRRPSP